MSVRYRIVKAELLALAAGFSWIELVLAAPQSSTPGNIAFQYPQASDLMRQYFLLRYALMGLTPIYYACLVYFLLQCGLIGKVQDYFFGRHRNYLVQASLTCSIYYLVYFLIKLPILVYSSYFLEHWFGLSNESFWQFFVEQAKSFFLLFALAIPIACLCLLTVRKHPQNWHNPIWIILSTTIFFLAFVEPLFIDPIFNHFVEIPNSSLKYKIGELCQKAGLKRPKLLIADKSKQTKKLNAYVNGFGDSQRVVLFDNLANGQVKEDEVLAVVAHELGHYKLKHVFLGLALAITCLYPLLLLGQIALNKFLPVFPRRWGIKAGSDPAILAIWCIVISAGSLIISPVVSIISRYFESEADRYAVNLTGDPMACARMFSTLAKTNLAEPDPPAIVEFWFFSHPSIKHRIDQALLQVRKAEEK